MPKYLKLDSEILKRIEEAEKALDDIGISIEFGQSIVITDRKSGMVFEAIEEREYNFPRSCDCRFRLIEQ